MKTIIKIEFPEHPNLKTLKMTCATIIDLMDAFEQLSKSIPRSKDES